MVLILILTIWSSSEYLSKPPTKKKVKFSLKFKQIQLCTNTRIQNTTTAYNYQPTNYKHQKT